jgi:hypothetical protein
MITDHVKQHAIGITFVALYLIAGVAVSFVNPIHEATDEIRHYRYVRYIADFGRLPVQSEAQGNAQAHHPPLYYATAALTSFWVDVTDPLYEPERNPYWGFRNWEIGTDNKNIYIHPPSENWPLRDAPLASHVARWTTLLWGAGAVALTYVTAYIIDPQKRAFHLAAVSLIAFNPMFVYLGAAVNNDVPAGLAGAAILVMCLLTIKKGLKWQRAAILGALYGLGMLVKFNLLAMAAPIGITLIIAPIPAGQKRLPTVARFTLLIALITAIISGWWYLRNAILYGEPTGFIRLTEIWGFRDPSEGAYLAARELQYAWTTLWGRFGYGQVPLPNGFYIMTAVICALGLVGGGVYLIARRRTIEPQQWRMFGITALAAFVNFLVLYTYILVSPAGAMGRFVFPGLSAFAVLVAFGLTQPFPRKAAWVPGGLMTAAMAALLLITIFAYLAPAYAPPPTIANTAESDTAVQFGDVATAHSVTTSLTDDSITPGQQIDVTVTWEALRTTDVPYTVFVILQTREGLPLAERYTYPGLGSYPTHHWQPGVTFQETYRLFLSDTLVEYEGAKLIVGLFHPQRGRLPIEDNADNAITAAQVDVVPRSESDYPNPLYVNYGDAFALVGYELDTLAAAPGEAFTATFYWRALNPPTDEPYNVFFHLKDAGTGWNVYGGDDGKPVTPDTLTTAWQPGEVYIDERTIQVPPGMTPGVYEFELGWFSDVDGERLLILDDEDGGRIIDSWLPLHQVLITAP